MSETITINVKQDITTAAEASTMLHLMTNHKPILMPSPLDYVINAVNWYRFVARKFSKFVELAPEFRLTRDIRDFDLIAEGILFVLYDLYAVITGDMTDDDIIPYVENVIIG